MIIPKYLRYSKLQSTIEEREIHGILQVDDYVATFPRGFFASSFCSSKKVDSAIRIRYRTDSYHSSTPPYITSKSQHSRINPNLSWYTLTIRWYVNAISTLFWRDFTNFDSILANRGRNNGHSWFYYITLISLVNLTLFQYQFTVKI